ncbi:UNVERIFIED_CONTAM: hypothetical protein FKN15_050522 [Acipenser sinensis]
MAWKLNSVWIGMMLLQTLARESVDVCMKNKAAYTFPKPMHGFTSVAHRDAFVCHHNVNDGLAGSCVSCSDLQLCFNASLYLTLHFPSVSERHRGRYTVSWEVNDGGGESSFLTLEVTECATVPVQLSATTIESNNINLRLYPSHQETCNGTFGSKLPEKLGCTGD